MPTFECSIACLFHFRTRSSHSFLQFCKPIVHISFWIYSYWVIAKNILRAHQRERTKVRRVACWSYEDCIATLRLLSSINFYSLLTEHKIAIHEFAISVFVIENKCIWWSVSFLQIPLRASIVKLIRKWYKWKRRN